MTTQALDMPLDVPWQRLAFSTDMIETNMNDDGLPPKWRSSLAAYAYVVAAEDSQEQYPDRRIVYLKLTTSITGWCPREDLLNAVDLGGVTDPHLTSGWQAVMGSDWASKYWPCLGAIAQIAIYPNPSTGVALSDYPYILDFEPKKRELYEAVSATNEFLSDTANKVGTQKGTTTTDSTEAKVGYGLTSAIPSLSGGVTNTTTRQEIEQRTTDTSTESRETQSHTTQFSQMYQLFNGYHLGTNRALFIVFPRPHTVSDKSQLDQNLVNGERQLEGIQEMFLVVSLPKTMAGFCVKAWLDTGHTVPATDISTVAAQALVWTPSVAQPNGRPPDTNSPVRTPSGSGTTTPPSTDEIVMTRRWVAGCCQFDGDSLVPSPVPTPPPHVGTIISGVATRPVAASVLALRGGTQPQTGDARAQLANDLNTLQVTTRKAMLDAFGSGIYTPTPFVKSSALWALLPRVLRNVAVDLDGLAANGYVTADQLAILRKARIDTTAAIFAAAESTTLDPSTAKVVEAVRTKLLTGLWQRVQKTAPPATSK
jgi:hypothetical protein